MSTRWTKEQLDAINTRGCNLLVAAAAGSGKTAVLVERIIKIITNEENPVDIDKLLVVTFTSAAASEMRERIAAAISKSLEDNPNSKNLQRQLTLLGISNITTMHSFCLDVIKNYYHVIDLDPTFRISDETENTLLKLEVIEDLFEDYYDKEDKDFRDLVEAYSNSKSDEKLKEMILSLYNFSMSGANPAKWLSENSSMFNINTIDELDKSKWIEVLKDTLKVEVDGYIKMIEQSLDIIRDTEGLEPYELNFLDDLSMFKSLRESLNSRIDDISIAVSNINFSRLKSVKKDKVSDLSSLEHVKSVRDTIKKNLSKLKEDTFSMSANEMLETIKNSYPYMNMICKLTLEFLERFRGKKNDRNILDFNDLEHLCLKILIEEGDEINPSSVALKFREYFDEVLVDEYQDSNNVQEAIIDLVSRKNLENPNVFMVGDVKQSIYRFRQAKPELFLDKYNRYPLEDGSRDKKIQLYKNFRSREEVIEGSNYIFKMLMSKRVGELEYDDSEALNLGASFKENEEDDVYVGGPVELHILDKAGEVSFDEDEENEEVEEDIDAISLEARIIANRINELLNPDKNGKVFKVLDKETGNYRPLKYKDIVILLRATRNWSEILIEELGSKGIPVYADTNSGYFETIEIRTIISLLKIIDNPMQDIPIISVLKSPIVNFSAEELADIRLLDKEKYFYEIIKCIANEEYEVKGEIFEKCKEFIKSLDGWRDRAVYTPIDEFIWHLYMDTSYYGYVGAMPNGKLRQANLKILFQRARQFEKTSFKGVFNFINFINKLRSSSGDMGSAKILGENEDVVRIMSIHKSKGLEFPVVFLSGAGKQFNLMDLNKSILFHDELGLGPEFVDLETRNSYATLAKEAIKKKILFETLSEEMRILYVALTRAKEKLIITGAARALDKSVSRWVQSASLDDNIILPSEVLKCRSFLDWIGMAVAKHRDGETIREYAQSDVSNISDDLSTWEVRMWNKRSLLVDKNEEAVDKNLKSNLFITSEIEKIDEEIERRLNYKYKYNLASGLSSNVSVSDLKKAMYESEDDELLTLNLFKSKEVLTPKFLIEEKGVTSALRGTIAHLIMQKLDLNKVSSEEEINFQIENMKDKNIITEEEAKSVIKIGFVWFFRSKLGRRLLKSFKENLLVKRELPFYTEISATEVDKTLPSNIYKGEKIRLQGIIDCIFEEDGEIVLLDYKTDYVEANQEEEIVEKYKMQLKYYKDAVEKITGKKVKASYLYLFGISKEVKVEI